ncbi:hypothetical protein EZS27_031760 [termite gut metagenome]|uniref:Uncharacterized protein n=1 Tax=termite gut metagenome TaxID=433724 RepID=A0A5J4QB17_9ZZZZ
MNTELKVSFYLKRERKNEKDGIICNPAYPIVGKIIIGKTIAQFSSKLKVEEKLWNVKSGRTIGKSKVATELNREINKLNLSIHSHYKDILKRTGKVTAMEVKNAFQGIASAQKTLLVFFDEIMQEFHFRVGIDRAPSSYSQYVNTNKHIKRFLKEKYHVRDIPLNQLDLPFIENFDFYLRIERKLKASSVNATIVQLLSMGRTALHRNLVSRPPFFGYKLERPVFQIRTLSANEFERLVSTPISSKELCFVRDLFVFASFTGISYIDLKNLTWKEILREEDGSLWISKSRQKTGIPFNVKLLNIPVRIIEKYRGITNGDDVFSVSTLVNINFALKKIAKLCAIDRVLSFHLARHRISPFCLKTSKLQNYFCGQVTI